MFWRRANKRLIHRSYTPAIRNENEYTSYTVCVLEMFFASSIRRTIARTATVQGKASIFPVVIASHFDSHSVLCVCGGGGMEGAFRVSIKLINFWCGQFASRRYYAKRMSCTILDVTERRTLGHIAFFFPFFVTFLLFFLALRFLCYSNSENAQCDAVLFSFLHSFHSFALLLPLHIDDS